MTPTAPPLVIYRSSTPTARDQQFDELWKRGMDDIGVKLEMVKVESPASRFARRRIRVVCPWLLGSINVGQNIDQLAEWIAHEEPAHSPGLVGRAVLDGDLRLLYSR